MGFINGLLNGGMGYQAASPISPGQVQGALGNTNQGLSFQQALLQALGNSGVANQGTVFNQGQGLLNGPIASLIAGTGPNPALTQLATATGQNTANTAATMAGQRGVSANPGLIAREAGMAGANNQQQEAGQAATLMAQQQLGGIQAAQSQQGMLGNIAGQQVGETQGAISGFNNAAGNQLNTSAGAVGNANNANATVAGATAGAQKGLLGGLASGIGSALALSDGGEVPGGPASGAARHMMKMRAGGSVKGKAKVAGDSKSNDTVHALLSPGEIVVPRSHATDPDKAAAFVRAIIARKHK